MHCIVRYIATFQQRGLPDQQVVAVCREEREPDEWGDPGRLLRRQLIAIEGPAGPGIFERLTNPDDRTAANFNLRLLQRLSPFCWAES